MKKHVLSLMLIFTTAHAMQQSMTTISPEKKATFIALQKISAQAHIIANELKDVCDLEISKSPTLDFSKGQTKQGLRLIVRTYPRFLETPWGLVSLFTKAECNNPQHLDLASNKLFEKINATFVEKLSDWPYQNNNEARLKRNFRTEIALRSCDSNGQILGTTIMLQNNTDLTNCHGNIYTIDALNGEPCPAVVLCPKTEYRALEELKSELQLLKEMTKNGSRATTPSTKTPPSPKTWFERISPKQASPEQTVSKETASGSLASSSTSFTSARSNFTNSLSNLPTPEPVSPKSPLPSRPNSPSILNSSTLIPSVAPTSPRTSAKNEKCSLM